MLHAALVAAAVLGALGLVLFLVNAATARRLPRAGPRRGSGVPTPRVSVIVPARNEEADVEAAVRSHLAQDYSDLEVIVVDDRSTDATPEVLARLASEHPRLRVLRGTEPPPGWLGKPHALHQGAACATGELLLFADADVRYDPTAVRDGVEELEARGLALLAYFPRLEMEGFWENVLMPYLSVAYFFGPGFLMNSDSQRLVAAGGGAGMLVRRPAYVAAGGHEALRGSVIDDIHLASRVRRTGGRCRMVLANDRVRVRMYRGFRAVFDGFTKNVAWVFQGAAALPIALWTFTSLALSILPAVVLGAAAAGARVAPGDVRLAALALGLVAAGRLGLARMLRHPAWAAFTQPLMASVWSAIVLRSLFRRFARREVVWRGRRYDAAGTGF